MAVRRVSKVDDFFDASQCLEIVEKTVEEFDSDPSNTRALDSLDIFAGKGNFCAECQAGGKTSMTVDILHDKKNHDILTRTGFFYVLQCILTMVEYGMILCGPPCGLFVFLSASYHRRSMDFPYGDQSKPKIRGANQLVINLIVLLAVAHKRKIFFVMEQPASSVLWIFPELDRFWRFLEGVRTHTWMRKFGHPLPKPTVLFSNVCREFLIPLAGKWSKKMEKIWQRILASRLASSPAIALLWKHKARYLRTALKFRAWYKHRCANEVFYRKHLSKSKRRVFVSGGKKLKDSGIYTRPFCRAVMDVWASAAAVQDNGLTLPLQIRDHVTIWRESFKGSFTEPDTLVVEQITKTLTYLESTIAVLD